MKLRTEVPMGYKKMTKLLKKHAAAVFSTTGRITDKQEEILHAGGMIMSTNFDYVVRYT